MKADPRDLIRAHNATLIDNRTGKARFLDHLLFDGLPLAVAIGCWALGVALPDIVSVGLLTVAGLLSAFFFGAMLQVSQRALDWADQSPEQGIETSRHARFLGEIAANAAYASLVCIVTAAVFVVAAASAANHHTAQVIFSSLGLGLSVHLMLLLLMVMKRIYALTQKRLTGIRTGATVTQLRKTG